MRHEVVNMNLSEAKALFEKHHPVETSSIKQGVLYHKELAACTWHGFKSALKVTGQLEEE